MIFQPNFLVKALFISEMIGLAGQFFQMEATLVC